MEQFINYIKSYISLSTEAEKALRKVALEETVVKNTTLLKEGKTCNRMYFLVSGTVRTFFYQNGKDITHWISPENSIFTAFNSYIMQRPSTEYIETTEDATIVSITYDEWQELYKNHPELERFGRLIMEEQMALIDEFYKGYYFLTAKEKYNLLIESYPAVLQKANLGHIASMLGISQETLSRIRGK